MMKIDDVLRYLLITSRKNHINYVDILILSGSRCCPNRYRIVSESNRDNLSQRDHNSWFVRIGRKCDVILVEEEGPIVEHRKSL